MRFSRVPEKVPEKVWEALVQSQVKFNRVPGKVPEKSGRLWCKARSGSTGFRNKFLRRFREALKAEPGKVNSTGFRRRFPRRSEALVQSRQVQVGAEPGQIQQGSGEGSGEGSGRLWCKARSGSTGIRRSFRRRSEALVQSPIRCNRVPEKVPVKVWEAFGAEPGQV